RVKSSIEPCISQIFHTSEHLASSVQIYISGLHLDTPFRRYSVNLN
ncbi:hypothetical protein LINPERPRIM_LOCUS22695, partial [Linum perenne]